MKKETNPRSRLLARVFVPLVLALLVSGQAGAGIVGCSSHDGASPSAPDQDAAVGGATSSGGPNGTSGDGGVSNDGSTSDAADGGGGGDVDAGHAAFTALHTYYVSPTGDDAHGGTNATTDAWATPHHAVDCGDVIIASAGSYANGQFGPGSWGEVSNCPSTSAGIDGSGGIYFATVLCAGPDIASCSVNGGANEAFRVDTSNWAVEGFLGTQDHTANGGCYSATSESTTMLHHIAFINDIASNCALAGFDSYSWHPSGGGVDQTAVVGAIAYNGAPSDNGSGLCGSGLSLIPLNGPDTSAGTHVFVAGAFVYKNVNAPEGAGCNTDGEGLIFDSWGIPNYHYDAVVEQNVFWANGSAGFEAFPQGNGTTDDAAPIFIFDNTSYGNYQDPKNPGGGELFLNQVYPSGTGHYAITNNIFDATVLHPGDGANGDVVGAGADIACTNGCPETVLGISGNYIWNSHAPTTTANGGANTHAWYGGDDQGANWPWGTNTYGDPGFHNPGSLPSAGPSCAGYGNTTDCMNTKYSVAANLTPNGGAAGKGYQPPGACTADAHYPTWLKGVVYLSVNGSTITENGGLITKPCGL